MAWRLGTWHGESPFARLDELLGRAEILQGWEDEHTILENPEFAVFWSLVWQLQVAEHLVSVGGGVRWGNPGPDLSVQIDSRRLFVECYVFRKSFGLKLFLEDVLSRVGNDIKLDHDYCLPFSLPSNDATLGFLDTALRPFLDDAGMERLRAQARQRYPVIVVRPASSLIIYLDGDDPAEYDPDAVPSPTGDPERYLEVILREAVTQKTGANSLSQHRPNLVAVNYLLSTDAHVAFHLRGRQTRVDLPESIDGFAVSLVGIDARLSREQLLLFKTVEPHDSILDAVAVAPQ